MCIVNIWEELNDSFPTTQLLFDGFSKPYRLDCCSDGGGILQYVKDDISSLFITQHDYRITFEWFFIEINTRNKKWLLCCLYNPSKINISHHISHLSKGLDNYINHYDNIFFCKILILNHQKIVLMSFAMFIILQTLSKNQDFSKTLIIHLE